MASAATSATFAAEAQSSGLLEAALVVLEAAETADHSDVVITDQPAVRTAAVAVVLGLASCSAGRDLLATCGSGPAVQSGVLAAQFVGMRGASPLGLACSLLAVPNESILGPGKCVFMLRCDYGIIQVGW